MSGELLPERKADLAFAIAQGASLRKSAEANGVPKTNAYPLDRGALAAEYDPAWHVRCAINAGASRHTAPVFFQVKAEPATERPRVAVFGEYHALSQEANVPTIFLANRQRKWQLSAGI